MTKLERWVMGRIISGRVKRRASYGVYVPAKSLDTPPYDAGQPSEALPIQQRIGPRVSEQFKDVVSKPALEICTSLHL